VPRHENGPPNGACSLDAVPASNRHSAATKELVVQLRDLGHPAGCRAVEQWAAWGLAPAAERISRGRNGFTSSYPEEAVEQYSAVAAVMRRGLDWRTAGLRLIGRGHRVAKDATFRLLLDFLFSLDTDTEDPLQFADDQIAEAETDPLVRRITRITRANINAAKIRDPVTGAGLNSGTVARAVMIRSIASMLGEPMPRDAAEEVAAAWGLISSEMPIYVRSHRVDYVQALAETVITFEQLSSAAKTVDPARLQMAIRDFREATAYEAPPALKLLPPALADVLAVAIGLTTVMIEDLGGVDWFEQISPGASDAETRYQRISQPE
jgi:hypothetical protein